VCKNEPPFAAAEVSGAVTSSRSWTPRSATRPCSTRPVEKVMGPKLPTVGVGQAALRVVEMLDKAPALLVLAAAGRSRS
jgi:cystathionine beta-synthase